MITYVYAQTKHRRTSGVIPLHGEAGFAGMRKAGRLTAEALDYAAQRFGGISATTRAAPGRRDLPLSVGLLALPDTTASTLFGLFDLLQGTCRDWQMLMHQSEVDSPFRPLILSRDGLPLHGYLTLPPGSDGKNLPLIVNPHGGPIGPRDNWGFNWEAQLLASRGYAVLQVNYRGSGGYGKAFQDAGHQQWGQRGWA